MKFARIVRNASRAKRGEASKYLEKNVISGRGVSSGGTLRAKARASASLRNGGEGVLHTDFENKKLFGLHMKKSYDWAYFRARFGEN